MKKDHRLEVARYALVVRTVIADLEGLKRTVPEHAKAALRLVEDWLEEKDVDTEALQAAADLSFEEGVKFEQREKDQSTIWIRTAAGNLAWYAKKDRGWQTGGQPLMDAAFYSLSSLNIPGLKNNKDLEKLRLTATVKPATKKASKPAKPKPVDLSEFIGAAAQKSLKKRKPVFETDKRAEEKELRSLLQEKKYQAHEAAVTFELRYGGLVFADAPGEEGYDWVIGAYACLQSGAHKDPRGKKADWIPVAYSPNDCIFYLTADGSAWVDDTIEGGDPEKFAENGDEMMKRIVSDLR